MSLESFNERRFVTPHLKGIFHDLAIGESIFALREERHAGGRQGFQRLFRQHSP